MKEKDELLVADFFKEYKQQALDDGGFSRKVMQNLPHTEGVPLYVLNAVWTSACIAVGLVLFFLFDGADSLVLFAENVRAGVLAALSSVEIGSPSLLVWAAAFMTLVYVGFYNVVTSE